MSSRGFTSWEELRKFFVRNLPSDTENTQDIAEIEMGYIEAGHGSKGKKIWLCINIGLKEMYQFYEGKHQLNLYTQKEDYN